MADPLADAAGIKIGSGGASLQLGGKTPLFILGPCVMESVDFTWQMAHDIKAVCDRLGVGFVFKASYDKYPADKLA